MFEEKETEEKFKLDTLIKKSRVHLYKPIQIAEILYRDRIFQDIDLSNLESYRTKSKKWRDIVSKKLVGRTSTSSAKFQDNLFDENALTPNIIFKLGDTNRKENGSVEKYIYSKFEDRFSQLAASIAYCKDNGIDKFKLDEFLALFWNDPGLKRSIDKIYEIVVYAIFSALVELLDVTIKINVNKNNLDILDEFEDFTEKILNLNKNNLSSNIPAKIFRAGVTNAADRGLDMWASFGLAIQIKHLSLSEELAQGVVDQISADRIVIVCKDVEAKTILSLLNQIGWKSKIQSIVTWTDLEKWWEKALRGKYSGLVGNKVLNNLRNSVNDEFPSINNELKYFLKERNYI